MIRLKNKLRSILRDKRGMSFAIELAVLFIVFIMTLALFTSFFSVYAKHNLVNSMAHEIARYVEINGEINADTYTEFERLQRAAGFDSATLEFDRSSGKIPLEDPFTVTVTVNQKFGIGSVQVVPVTVKAVATGRSEVYWK